MEGKPTLNGMKKNSPDFLEFPVFTKPQREPESMGYEKAITDFEELIKEFRLFERPRPQEDIPEFKM